MVQSLDQSFAYKSQKAQAVHLLNGQLNLPNEIKPTPANNESLALIRCCSCKARVDAQAQILPMRRESSSFALLVEQDVSVGRLHGAGCKLAHVLVIEGVPERCTRKHTESPPTAWPACCRWLASHRKRKAMLTFKGSMLLTRQPAIMDLSQLHAMVTFDRRQMPRRSTTHNLEE